MLWEVGRRAAVDREALKQLLDRAQAAGMDSTGPFALVVHLALVKVALPDVSRMSLRTSSPQDILTSHRCMLSCLRQSGTELLAGTTAEDGAGEFPALEVQRKVVRFL